MAEKSKFGSRRHFLAEFNRKETDKSEDDLEYTTQDSTFTGSFSGKMPSRNRSQRRNRNNSLLVLQQLTNHNDSLTFDNSDGDLVDTKFRLNEVKRAFLRKSLIRGFFSGDFSSSGSESELTISSSG